jgi:co-chaperonin GroES (HSP10)
MSLIWKAAADRVIIKKASATGPRRTAGGLYLPDKMKAKGIDEGVVLAAGPDAKGVKPGDRAFFINNGNAGALEIQPDIFSVNADYVAGLIRDESDQGTLVGFEVETRERLGDAIVAL